VPVVRDDAEWPRLVRLAGLECRCWQPWGPGARAPALGKPIHCEDDVIKVRTQYPTLLVLVAVLGLGTVIPVGLAAYVGLQQPETSRLTLKGDGENQLLTTLLYAPPGLEPTLTLDEAEIAHGAPWLVAPAPGAVYSGADASEVTFVWTTGAGLDDDEEFRVQIWCSGKDGVVSAEHWTREKRLTLGWSDQMDCIDDSYFWRVTIYRLDDATSTDRGNATPSSTPSDIRSLTWHAVTSLEGWR